jgi:uncharacterized protein YdeI (YjbR/CyaY-like superfamily)
MNIGETLDARSPDDFFDWLTANGQSKQEIWVILYKKSSGKQTVTYAQLVETALCHGWIDGLMKGMDDQRYAQRFTPRRKKSNWTDANKALARRLLAEGRMTAAGQAALPEEMRQ